MDDSLLRFAKDKKFVFIDCETLNLCLHEFNNHPWQIAMIEVENNETTQKHDLYLDWKSDLVISKEAARITRFNQFDFNKKKKPAADVMQLVFKTLQDADYIVGHNLLGFDVYILRLAFLKVGLPWKFIMPKIIDTFALMKGVRLENKIPKGEDLLVYQYKQLHEIRKGLRCSLGVIGKDFGIEHDYDKLHDALVDLELNIKVWNKIKYMIDA